MAALLAGRRAVPSPMLRALSQHSGTLRALTSQGLAAPKVEGKAPYVPPPSLNQILESSSPQTALKLDWNEGTAPPPRSVYDAINKCLASDIHQLNWYPQMSGSGLMPALEKYTGLSHDHFIVTNGSDDGLRLIFDTFLEKGDKVLVPQPTYTQVYVFFNSHGAEMVPVEMPDPFGNDEATLREHIVAHRPKIVYLVTPNNPTGAEWAPEQVAKLCQDFPEILFINDEAYFEFGQHRQGAVEALSTLGNAVITRTFSKCYGLAALRCGYLVAHPELVKKLLLFYNHKSVNQVAQVAAAAALGEQEYYKSYAAEVCATRDALVAWCKSKGFQAEGGGGNFACVKMPDGVQVKDVVQKMSTNHGIWVRDINERFHGYFRVTVGTEEQMERFKVALQDAIG